MTNFHMPIHCKNEKWMIQIPFVEKCINWDGWHIFTNVACFNQRLCVSDDDYIEHGLMTYVQDALNILWRYCGNLNVIIKPHLGNNILFCDINDAWYQLSWSTHIVTQDMHTTSFATFVIMIIYLIPLMWIGLEYV
jgi:hypothetical protein